MYNIISNIIDVFNITMIRRLLTIEFSHEYIDVLPATHLVSRNTNNFGIRILYRNSRF